MLPTRSMMTAETRLDNSATDSGAVYHLPLTRPAHNSAWSQWSHADGHGEHAPAIEKELTQLAAEQQRCCQEGKRVLVRW
jgi:hypothetical protein